MAITTIKFKRGNKIDLPDTVDIGEPLIALDTEELFIGNNKGVPIKVSDIIVSNKEPENKNKLWWDINTDRLKRYNVNDWALLIGADLSNYYTKVQSDIKQNEIMLHIENINSSNAINNTKLSNTFNDINTNFSNITTLISEKSAVKASTNGNININSIDTAVYTHPQNHIANIIIQDSNNRFTTDAEKTLWNSKQPAGNYLTENEMITISGDIVGSGKNTIILNLKNVGNAGIQNPKVTTDLKGRVLSSTALVAADIPMLSLSNISDAGNVASKNTGTTVGTIPILDLNGKLDINILPPITITDTFVVATQTDMLSLSAQIGDVCIRTDLNKTFILKTINANILANWQELLTPTDLVSSVSGKSGVVVLTKNDVGLSSVDNKSSATIISEITKDNIITLLGFTPSIVAKTGNFNDLINKPTTLAGYGISDGVSSQITDLITQGTVVDSMNIFTLDLSSCKNYTIVISDSNMKTLTFTNIPSDLGFTKPITVKVICTGGNVITTFPSGTIWADGLTPIFILSKTYYLTFIRIPTGWHAMYLGAF